MQRCAIEQQAIAGAKGVAAEEVTSGDVDRNRNQGGRVVKVQSPFGRVNDDEMLAVRCRSNSVGFGRPRPPGAVSAQTEVRRQRDYLRCPLLAAGIESHAPEKRPAGNGEVG